MNYAFNYAINNFMHLVSGKIWGKIMLKMKSVVHPINAFNMHSLIGME